VRESEAIEQARRALGAQLAACRRAAGYSQAEFAPLTRYSRSTVANVETGRQRVPADFWAHADAALHAGGVLMQASSQLEATARREREQHAATRRVALEASLTAARPAPPTAGSPATGTGAPDPALALSGEEAPDDLELIDLARRSEKSDLGAGTVEALWVAVDRLCRRYPTVPAPVLRADAARYLRYVLRLLDGRITLAQHRDLLVQAGWLAALLACVCYDAGAASQARTARRMTRQLGEQAGHGELVGWSFEIAAWFALVEGRYAETVALSEVGAAHAGPTNAGVQCTLQAARGYARLRDSRVRDALNAGRALLDRMPEPSNPEHHFVFDRAKYEFYVATIYTWLGSDDTAAAEHARWVVGQCCRPEGIRWPMRYADSQIDLALVAGRRRDLDEAVACGKAALVLERRSAQLIPRAVELERELAAQYPREPLVTEFKELLAEEISGDAARLGDVVASRVRSVGS
jgi:transcriptional regulator with XRE-family HTH domain